MNRSIFYVLILCLTAFSLPAFAQDAEPSAAKPTDAAKPDAAKTDAAKNDADQLAKKVVEATGDPRELATLEFSFVVERDGKEVSRRNHIWRPKAGELAITSREKTYKLAHLHDFDLTKLSEDPAANAEKWQKIAPKLSPKDAAKAWSWFINDSYWLLVPAKLLDPGVNRKIDEKGRLILTFGEVGLTPGDTYALTIDDSTAQVSRWDFELQGGQKGGFVWSDYKKIGPLTLSTTRTSDDGKTVIRFENLRAEP
jgi:hypothetical protein